MIRYGLIGLGRSGWDLHAAAIKKRKDSKIVAVTDPISTRCQEAQYQFGCKIYDSFEKLILDENIDVVVIASPNSFHASQSIAALKSNKHVICEKPMATDSAAAEAMIEQAKRVNKKIFVFQRLRFSALYQHLKKVLDSGKLGRLYHVRYYNSCFYRRDDWQTLSIHGGGLLNNWGVTFLYLILLLLNSPIIKVCSDLQQIASGGDTEDHVKAFLQAKNGCTADIEMSTAQNLALPLPEWILCGTQGTLTYLNEKSVLRWFNPHEAGNVVASKSLAKEDRSYHWNSKPLNWQEKVTILPQDSLHQLVETEAFYDNVVQVLLGKATMLVTPESAKEVLVLMDKIRHGTPFILNK